MSAVPAPAGPLFDRVPAGARNALSRILGAIEPDPDGVARAFLGPPSLRIRLGWGPHAAPWQAKFVLGDIVGCHDFGPDEKLAWEFGLRFEGTSMTLAFQKFGLRAYFDTAVDEAAGERLADDLMRTIGRSMPLLEKTVLAEIADAQMAAGSVNVENHFTTLLDQYQHFSRLSGASAEAAEADQPVTNARPDGGVSPRLPSYGLRRQARFERDAAVNAFFSMIEHLLLVAFLLSGEDATNGALGDFIGAGWNDKFKRMVDLADADAKKMYDRLVAVHDELRNPAAHGRVHADGTDFSFLLPGVGPVPARLVMKGARQRAYQWRPAGGGADVLADLAEVERWLRSGPLASAVTYGESGLPLIFADGVRSDLVAARDDAERLAYEIEMIQRDFDRAADMDW